MLLSQIALALSSPLVHAPLMFCILRLLGRLRGNLPTYAYLSYIPIAWLFLCSMTYPSVVLIKPLEDRYPTVKIESTQWRSADAIVVLACNYFEDDGLSYVSRWPNCSLQRNLQAALMYKAFPMPIYIGGGILAQNDTESQASHNKAFFEYFGIPAKNIHAISEGTNTETEVAAIVSILKGKKVALVTSASHLPRAVKYFDKLGIQTVPIPVEHLSRKNINFTLGLPEASNLYRSERAIHEYLGIIYQKLYL